MSCGEERCPRGHRESVNNGIFASGRLFPYNAVNAVKNGGYPLCLFCFFFRFEWFMFEIFFFRFPYYEVENQGRRRDMKFVLKVII